jgi:hypothetical protein
LPQGALADFVFPVSAQAAPKQFYMIFLSILSVPDEGYFERT